LRSKGFKVTTAKNGKEAIEAVRKSADGEGEGPFDVVLMDQEVTRSPHNHPAADIVVPLRPC